MRKKNKDTKIYGISIWAATAIALGILIFSSAVVLYLSFKKPIVHQVHANISHNVKIDTLQMRYTFKIENPNFFSVKFDSISYDLFIKDKPCGYGKIAKKLILSAEDTSKFTFPLRFFLAEDVRKDTAAGLDFEIYKFKFKAYTHLFGRAICIPYTLSKKLPIFKQFDIKLDEIVLSDLSLQEAKINVSVHLENPNAMRFHSKKLEYNLYVARELVATGGTTAEYILEKEGKCNLQLPVKLRTKALVENFLLFKEKNKNDPFKLKLHVKLATKNNKPPYFIIADIEKYGQLKDIKSNGDKKSAKFKIDL